MRRRKRATMEKRPSSLPRSSPRRPRLSRSRRNQSRSQSQRSQLRPNQQSLSQLWRRPRARRRRPPRKSRQLRPRPRRRSNSRLLPAVARRRRKRRPSRPMVEPRRKLNLWMMAGAQLERVARRPTLGPMGPPRLHLPTTPVTAKPAARNRRPSHLLLNQMDTPQRQPATALRILSLPLNRPAANLRTRKRERPRQHNRPPMFLQCPCLLVAVRLLHLWRTSGLPSLSRARKSRYHSCVCKDLSSQLMEKRVFDMDTQGVAQ
mmetsp:Transcript_18817/g.29394  ORF Transcript_18817/g.29394 Transcript_18817/m.29394 type:complete len:262 (+) Transcript_18817:390-1175(+)